MAAQNRLQLEVDSLQKTIQSAACNPFLPAPARDAIVQAGFVITTMADELQQLRAQISRNGETVNGELGAMRQALAAHNIDVVL